MLCWGSAKARRVVNILFLKTWFRTICSSEQIQAMLIRGDSRIIAESGNAFALLIWIGSNPAVIIKITDYLCMSGTCESFSKGERKGLIRSISNTSLHLVLLFTLFKNYFLVSWHFSVYFQYVRTVELLHGSAFKFLPFFSQGYFCRWEDLCNMDYTNCVQIPPQSLETFSLYLACLWCHGVHSRFSSKSFQLCTSWLGSDD